MIRILEFVQQGSTAADIARMLNMNKSHVSYYIAKAKELGYIRQTLRDAFAVLIVTQPGKTLLDQYKKNNTSIPVCRLENIQLKAEITRMPTIPVDWKKIEMHNWVQYTSQIDSVKVRLNVGKVPTLELIPSPVDGDSPYDIIITIVYECVNALLELHDRIGLRVDKLQVISKPEWVVCDPLAKEFCKNNGQVTYEGIGKVNASKPRHIGELEFHDPRVLTDYMTMPTRVRNIDEKVDYLIDETKRKKELSPSLTLDHFIVDLNKH